MYQDLSQLGKTPRKSCSRIETITAKDLPPTKECAQQVTFIGQDEMPECKGITYYGYKPHLGYDNKAREKEGLSPLPTPAPSKCSEIDSNK
jgi:hypothetical protein